MQCLSLDKFQKAVRRTECLCHKETKRHADDTAADRKNRRLQRIDQKDLIAAASAAFQKGAEAALALLQENKITMAVLKSKSPSCGKGLIYDGSFTRTLKPGSGIAAELFSQNGVRVLTEEEWKEEKENSQNA